MRRILVYEYLSAGGPVDSEAQAAELLAQGVAMRDAVVADLLGVPGVALTVAACDRPGAGVPQGAAGAAVGVATAGAGEPPVEFVRRAARGHDLVWVIAPETDGLLARLHDAVGAQRWIGCTADAIRLASSKAATLRALAQRRVPTPLAFDGERVGGWVVKPDDGAGALDGRVHATRAAAEADLHQRRRAGRSATLEPFVQGQALSLSLLAGPGFVQPLACNRQRVAIEADGVLAYRGVEVGAVDLRTDPRAVRLHTVALDVARAVPGLRGYVGVDLVWHAARGPVVIEINPRVTCSYVGLSDALGRNVAGEIVLLHDLPEPADA